MTHTRMPISISKSPALTGGEDRPRPACAGNWLPYWALIENPHDLYAARDCAVICGTCPIAATCLGRPYDKHWTKAAAAILRILISPRKVLDKEESPA